MSTDVLVDEQDPHGAGVTRGRRRRATLLAILVALAMVAGACASSDHAIPLPPTTTAPTPTTPAEPLLPSSTTQPPGQPSLDAGADCPPPDLEAPGIAPGGWWPGISPAEQEADLDAMAAAGVRWFRIGFNWSSINPEPGVLEWERWDRIVDAVRERCMDVVGLVLFTPPWARHSDCRGDHVCRPRDPEEYGRFAGTLAARYAERGVGVFELWNEPNIALFFKPRPDAGVYADMLDAGTTAVHEAAPGSLVVSAGLAPVLGTSDGQRVNPATFLAEVIDDGAMDEVDAVGFHPYSFPAPPTRPNGRNGFADLLPAVERVLADAGLDDRPLWFTEFGVPTGDTDFSVAEPTQVDHLQSAFALWRAHPNAGPLIWYAWRDAGRDANDVEDNFGLLDRSGRPKPALAAFEVAAAQR